MTRLLAALAVASGLAAPCARAAAAAGGAAAPAGGPAAPAEAETLLKAMSDEMDRSLKRLDMERLGRPYFMAYTLRDTRELGLSASFGGLKDPNVSRSREAVVDLRVGKAEFDNTHYVGSDFGGFRPHSGEAPVEEDYDALRFALWSLTDRAYKQSLEKFSQKKAYKHAKNLHEELPDLSSEPVATRFEPAPRPPFDRAAWEDRVRRLSAVFRDHPAIQRSGAEFTWTSRVSYFADSEGRRAVKPAGAYELTLAAEAQAKDGFKVSDRRRVVRLAVEELPSFEELEREAGDLAERVSETAKGEVLESYLGPVLFEGQAAAEFFNQLLARNLSAPRSMWIEEDWAKKHFKAGELAPRLGLRALAPLLSAYDDPALESWEGAPLAGRYRVDDQGIPASRVTLAERGILKEIYMSRTPIKERRRSNGHGRAGSGEMVVARPGVLVVAARESLPAAQLKSELLKRARDFGLQYALVIRRIAEETEKEDDEALAPPVLVYKVFVDDGREEAVRNARFSDVTLRALRDVAAASSDSFVHNYRHWGPYVYARSWVPATLICPSVLISELELKKTDKKPEKPSYLPHPHFAR